MFGKLLGKKKPQTTQTPKLSTAITTSILGVVGNKSIPTMPGAAQKAFTLATDPTAEARDFIEVIESDEALSARVIKIANSVFFDRGKPSKTIEESVLVIGINELRCLLNATTLTDIFPSKHPVRAQLWAHDVAVGLIARSLAQRLLPSQAEVAFLGGLMHDVGKLLLIQRSSEDYQKVLKFIEDGNGDYCKAEGSIFVFDHTEVGQLIAERWNFNQELIEVIRNHHNNWQDLVSSGLSLIALVKAADTFAHSLGLGHQRGLNSIRIQAQNEVEQTLEAIGIPLAEKNECLSRFQRTFETEFDLYSGKATA